MSFLGNDWRLRREPTYFKQNFKADYHTDIKTDMKDLYNEKLLNNLHSLRDPLMKNLGDTLPMNNMMEKPQNKSESTLSGITGFFTGMMQAFTGAVFRRPKTPDNPIIEQNWQQSNLKNMLNLTEKIDIKLQNQEIGEQMLYSGSVEDSFEDAFSPEDFMRMHSDAFIEYYIPSQYQNEVYFEVDAPKVKVDVSTVLPTTTLETVTVPQNYSLNSEQDTMNQTPLNSAVEGTLENQNLVETSNSEPQITTENVDSKLQPQICTENNLNSKPSLQNSVETINLKPEPQSTMETINWKSEPQDNEMLTIEQLEPQTFSEPQNSTTETISQPTDNMESKTTIETSERKDYVSSCEDKLARLKSLLQNRKKPNHTAIETLPSSETLKPPSETLPPPSPTENCVSSCEDKVAKLKMLLQNRKKPNHTQETETDTIDVKIEELNFGDELPTNYSSSEEFDEITGRFRKASLSSEDSFQIVFNDIPRTRLTSECDSEDSFIVFEDNPDDCYTSNDVFGDSDDSDSDSDCELYASKTVNNLADNSLYDEVDCGRVLSLNYYEEKKPKKSIKKVTFSTEPPKVHVMRVWAFAARQARAGHWERYALDRERFKRRINDVEMAVSWVLKPQHRSRIVFQRFMPWWNAKKRREEAEKLLEANKALEVEMEKFVEAQKSMEVEEKTSEVDETENLAKANEKLSEVVKVETEKLTELEVDIHSMKPVELPSEVQVEKSLEVDVETPKLLEAEEKLSEVQVEKPEVVVIMEEEKLSEEQKSLEVDIIKPEAQMETEKLADVAKKTMEENLFELENGTTDEKPNGHDINAQLDTPKCNLNANVVQVHTPQCLKSSFKSSEVTEFEVNDEYIRKKRC